MKNLLLALVTGVLLFPCFPVDAATAGSLGKVSFMIGKAKKKAAQQPQWAELRLNQKINDGDWIQTAGEERVELSLTDGSVLRVSENSEVVICGKAGQSVSTDLKQGNLWCNIKKLSQKSQDFQVKTGTAVAAIRGTVFKMQKDSTDTSTTVAVYNGKVDVGPDKALKDKQEAEKKAKGPEAREEVSGPTEVPGPYEVSLEDWVSIVAGMQINIRPDGRYDKKPIDAQKDTADAWVKFNQKRDQDLRLKGAAPAAADSVKKDSVEAPK